MPDRSLTEKYKTVMIKDKQAALLSCIIPAQLKNKCLWIDFKGVKKKSQENVAKRLHWSFTQEGEGEEWCKISRMIGKLSY